MATTRLVSARCCVCLVVWLTCALAPKSAQAQPKIDHPGVECIAPGKFAIILSGIEPDRDVRTAKVYFRSNLYPDFYYVEMTYENGRFQGILPQPSPETTRVIYYLEAVDGVFNGARSIEWDPPVQECDDDPAAAYFTGEQSGIVVGATTAGQSAIPAGFSAAGIAGTIAATGLASGIGGGVGVGTAAVAGAVAAGAAGAAVVATGPSEEPTSSTGIAGVASSSPTSSAPAPDPAPGSTSVPVPGSTTSVGTTTTIAGGTSSTGTTTVFGGTTTTAGSTTTSTGGASTSTATTTTPATTTIATTTVATTTAAAPLDADCFTVQVLGPCKVRVDASCVAMPVDRYEWTLDQNDDWLRVEFPNGPASIVYDWGGACGDDETLKFRLKVYRGGSSDVAHKDVTVPGSTLKAPPDAPGREPPTVRFESHLELPGAARGRIVANGTWSRIVEGAAPTRVEASGLIGENTMTGTLIASSREPGVWRFDFGSETRLEPGSLKVVRGEVLTVAPKVVVFRIHGRAGESVQFSYRVRR